MKEPATGLRLPTTVSAAALLTDFSDAHEESLPTDEALLRLAEARVNELNLKYGPGENEAATPTGCNGRRAIPGSPRREACSTYCTSTVELECGCRRWMGEERKRGKLADLNALLRGGNGEAFPRRWREGGPPAKSST